MEERLQKILAKAGVASRRAAEAMILAGRIKIDGQVVTAPGTKADPDKQAITVDDRPLPEPEKNVYLLLHKPAGYVTTRRDPQGRPTVLDLIGDVHVRLYPVGRLDYATEGLLLLTNDGEFTYLLTHPRHHIPKTYVATVKGVPAAAALEALAKGILLDGMPTAPAKVRLIAAKHGNAQVELVIHEGRNRQVRRMLESIGHPVLALKRTKLGPLTLAGVPVGKYRRLKAEEVARLKALATRG